ncbi:hypothetical protein EMPS_01783 [Entomortierella parvispora]|uniref:Extracellular membrane protein CFEM domain-containing protein n=1 Tax=Entomortierella parvispora TaxID=205924 RepID=A0A9P3H479_9FUNG|nr:hypothetical protein EMPS_01783 [Entomortierella parvispora]
MRATFIIAAIAAATTVSAYQCPDTTQINQACRSISVAPLVCNNPKVNVNECNAKQCNQTYINNYSDCQCRSNPNMFYEHSVNVQGLLKRCGVAGLTNPYGSPTQYRPGQGTQTFSASSSASGGIGAATRVYNGTAYYGGRNTVVSGTTRLVNATAVVHGTTIVRGTTTWVSGTPGIVSGTSTWGNGATRTGTTTAAPIVAPSETPVVKKQGRKLSGGAIAGIVIACLAALALLGLLGWCLSKRRKQHTIYNNQTTTSYDNRGPTRTVVTEKVEPVVVKSGAHQTYNNVPAGTTTYTTTQSVPVQQNYNTNTYGTNTATHPSTSYNTTTTGYNDARGAVNDVRGVANDVRNGVRGATNAANNAIH